MRSDDLRADATSQTSPLPRLESRRLSSGFAARTLKNLAYIKEAGEDARVHPVTQIVNSLIGLLIFPIAIEEDFFQEFSTVLLPAPPDVGGIRTALSERLSIPSLEIVAFEDCMDLRRFFQRLRNAISHKHVEFSGVDPDSKRLSEVMITLKDHPYRKKQKWPPDRFEWQIAMNTADLEQTTRYVADEIIRRGL